jgi:hypothetical protein
MLLKKAAMKFSLENAEDVLNLDSYSSLYQSPTLIKEVMLAMASYSKK